MENAKKGIFNQEDFHDPLLRNQNGFTVAMISAIYGTIDKMPLHWNHSPLLLDMNKRSTVAMLAAYNGNINILPSHWDHDPSIQDDNGYTVAMYVACWGDINILPK